MLIEQAMTTPAVKIMHDSNLMLAAQIAALSSVSDIMVVDKNNQFIGVLSEGDILRAAMPNTNEILNEGGTLEQAFHIFLENGKSLSKIKIAPLVIVNPITVAPHDHIAKATTIMIDKMIRRLPVVMEGTLLGTISRSDICRSVVGMF
jgi:predicted transcriptional regulator